MNKAGAVMAPTGMCRCRMPLVAVWLCVMVGVTEGGTPAGIRESDFCKSLEYAGVAVDEPGYHTWGTSPILAEDGYAFIMDKAVYLLTTDNHGVKVRGDGLLWKSADGIAFDPVPEIGYPSPRTLLPKIEYKMERSYYGAGTFQRPQILMQNGRPTHLYAPSGTNIIGSDGSLSYVMRVKPKKDNNN